MGDLSKDFSISEFACRCGCGRKGINPDLVARLQRIRDNFGAPITITSGVRCSVQNRAVGGKMTSAHLSGEAADVRCIDSRHRIRLVGLAIAEGINRIGIGKDFVHLDVSQSLPSDVMWLY